MKRVHLAEGAVPLTIQLPTDVAAALCKFEVATTTPAGAGEWIVSNIRKVGVVRVGDYQIDIRPKVSIPRLFFLMGFSAERDFWKRHDVTIDLDDELLNTVAEAFIRQTGKAIGQGLLQGYETIDESLHIFRGRLDVAAQVGRRGGLVLPAQVVFDEFTIDIAENKMLLGAAQRLLRMPSLARKHRTVLKKLTQSLDGVSTLPHGIGLPTVHFTRLNARYRDAVILAQLILRNTSLEQRPGEIVATAFLFDMWQIFEDFVTTALGDSLREIGGSVEAQVKGECLDIGGNINLRPDLIWKDGARVNAVIDAKYKAPKNSTYPNADIYQMLAYCVRFALRTGHLIYAKGEEEPHVHEIIGHNASIQCHAVDLDQDPASLLQQMGRIALKIHECVE
ncbi:McrC family protein [Arthrobacter bambusae]|uniref:McrC family protein n=1 Tax=Arthrobacter TaxID=1663 RepID=UPI001F50A512|nr:MULTISPECIES: McrC family protein [Arthrobacter]MCI0143165.1 McrC family protein [Arthrobacter bambusae]